MTSKRGSNVFRNIIVDTHTTLSNIFNREILTINIHTEWGKLRFKKH